MIVENINISIESLFNKSLWLRSMLFVLVFENVYIPCRFRMLANTLVNIPIILSLEWTIAMQSFFIRQHFLSSSSLLKYVQLCVNVVVDVNFTYIF